MVVGFIGSGNMARAIALGLQRSDDGPQRMVFVDPVSEKAEELAKTTAGLVATSNSEVVERSDIVILAFKPALLVQIAKELAEALKTKAPVVVSILAATPISRLEGFLPPGSKVIRLMPNVTVETGAGVVAYISGSSIDEEAIRKVVGLISKLGSAIEIDEGQIDAVMAISACSPAFLARFAQALTRAGVAHGLSEEMSAELASRVLAGTGELLLKREYDFELVQAQVASPGGSTEVGLQKMDELDIDSFIRTVVDAAIDKSLAVERSLTG